MDNLGKAIGSFERGLMTPGPFDEFLAGKMTALDGDALRGLELFIEFNCISCHTGPTVGGTMYQKLGSVKAYETKDEGRFKITKDEKDKYVFKVPGLRNVTKTAPYLHDGSATTLDDVLNIMATYQIPKGSLTDEERTYLKAFLASLEGKIVDPTYIAARAPARPAPTPRSPTSTDHFAGFTGFTGTAGLTGFVLPAFLWAASAAAISSSVSGDGSSRTVVVFI
jgi:cytochrome c peroxidase